MKTTAITIPRWNNDRFFNIPGSLSEPLPPPESGLLTVLILWEENLLALPEARLVSDRRGTRRSCLRLGHGRRSPYAGGSRGRRRIKLFPRSNQTWHHSI